MKIRKIPKFVCEVIKDDLWRCLKLTSFWKKLSGLKDCWTMSRENSSTLKVFLVIFLFFNFKAIDLRFYTLNLILEVLSTNICITVIIFFWKFTYLKNLNTLPFRQKTTSQDIFCFPFPLSLNENERNVKLKTKIFYSHKNDQKKRLDESFITNRKFSLLSIVAEDFLVSTTSAKHWFSMILTDWSELSGLLTVQSLIYLKNKN